MKDSKNLESKYNPSIIQIFKHILISFELNVQTESCGGVKEETLLGTKSSMLTRLLESD